MSSFKANMFARDLAACIALADARKRENAAARSRAMQNTELATVLHADSVRQGKGGRIDWKAYFQAIGIAD